MSLQLKVGIFVEINKDYIIPMMGISIVVHTNITDVNVAMQTIYFTDIFIKPKRQLHPLLEDWVGIAKISAGPNQEMVNLVAIRKLQNPFARWHFYYPAIVASERIYKARL